MALCKKQQQPQTEGQFGNPDMRLTKLANLAKLAGSKSSSSARRYVNDFKASAYAPALTLESLKASCTEAASMSIAVSSAEKELWTDPLADLADKGAPASSQSPPRP